MRDDSGIALTHHETPIHMKTKPFLSLDDLKRIAAASEAEAATHGWNVTIAIVDDGGHLLHLHRLDGAGASTAEMATGKARTAAVGRRETKLYEDMIKQGRVAFLSAPMTAMLEGGVPIMVGADMVGAVGVSGVKSDQDAAVAKAGIAALGIENV